MPWLTQIPCNRSNLGILGACNLFCPCIQQSQLQQPQSENCSVWSNNTRPGTYAYVLFQSPDSKCSTYILKLLHLPPSLADRPQAHIISICTVAVHI
jgi:hypothetical protein